MVRPILYVTLEPPVISTQRDVADGRLLLYHSVLQMGFVFPDSETETMAPRRRYWNPAALPPPLHVVPVALLVRSYKICLAL